MMADELKPCPFCGGDAEDYTRQNAGATRDWCGDASHWVGCTECGASTRMHEELAQAIAAWNDRPAPKADSALVGELRAMANRMIPPLRLEADALRKAADEIERLAALSDRDVVLEEAAKVAREWANEVLSGDEPPLFRQGALWASKHIPQAIRALKGGVDE